MSNVVRGVGYFLGAWIILILASCENQTSVRAYQDPYLESFYGKKIRKMISYDADDLLLTDTTSFDLAGNIVRIKQFGLVERREYDSLHFIRHLLVRNDVPENYFIDYFLDKEGHLIQHWTTVNHLDWYPRKDQKTRNERFVVFDLNSDGFVIKERDTVYNELVVLIYNDSEKLSRKDIHSIDKNELLWKVEYIYDKDLNLDRIEMKSDSIKLLTHYYSKENHLLDSSIDHITGYKTRYKYEFY
ncbi:MAG TPA: hypothetical protein VIN08_03690 [Ohtaekwangia sp.]|uniref:hypothetical protein n=1 Tax=Ohtaekwangia sp. TaxID=2066019 RepID=UPI002F92EFDE